jgi:hypothetical protein
MLPSSSSSSLTSSGTEIPFADALEAPSPSFPDSSDFSSLLSSFPSPSSFFLPFSLPFLFFSFLSFGSGFFSIPPCEVFFFLIFSLGPFPEFFFPCLAKHV